MYQITICFLDVKKVGVCANDFTDALYRVLDSDCCPRWTDDDDDDDVKRGWGEGVRRKLFCALGIEFPDRAEKRARCACYRQPTHSLSREIVVDFLSLSPSLSLFAGDIRRPDVDVQFQRRRPMRAAPPFSFASGRIRGVAYRACPRPREAKVMAAINMTYTLICLFDVSDLEIE